MNSSASPHPQIAQVQPTYFALQAYWGATKHMGGLRTTLELIDLCHIGRDSYVLDVGCGVGATPSHLARKIGCKVVGIDLSEAMIGRAREKVQRDGVAGRVEVRVADAQSLPMDDATFDAVIVESVMIFIPDKTKALRECVRVTRAGGYVGVNDEIWLQAPTPELVEYAAHAWDVHAEILTCERWRELLADARLEEITARGYKFGASFGEYLAEIRRYNMNEYLAMFSRAISLYVRNPSFRKYMKGRYSSLPKGFFDYLGYGIFVGRR